MSFKRRVAPKQSIRYQMRAMMFLVAFVMIAVSIMIFLMSFAQLKSKILDKNLTTSKMTGLQIDAMLADATRLLQSAAGDNALFYDSSAAQKQCAKILNDYDFFDLMSYRALDSSVAISYPPAAQAMPYYFDVIDTRSYYTIAAVEQRANVSTLFLSVALNQPHFSVAVPVLEGSETQGVLWGGVSLTRLHNRMSAVFDTFSGRILVIDQDGYLLLDSTQPVISELISCSDVIVHSDRAQYTVADLLASRSVSSGTWPGQTDSFAAISYMESTGWMVLALQSSAQLNNVALSAMAPYVVVTIPFLILFVLVVSMQIGRRLTDPITRLTGAVATAAPSNLKELSKLQHQLSDARYIEIEQLYCAFESLHERIREQESALVRDDRLRTIGQFTSAIVHDLGNPIAGIRTLLELMEQADLPEPLFDECLGAAKISLAHMEQSVLKFLQFSKVIDLTITACSVQDILRYSLGLLHASIAEKEIKVLRDTAPDLVVAGDMNFLQQAFINIIKNAVEAVGVNGLISIAVRQEDEFAVITVQDDGVGMSEATMNAIFEPFVSTKNSGTGLGLFMADSIIRRHNGSISVVSAMDAGTTFTVKLPLAQKGATSA